MVLLVGVAIGVLLWTQIGDVRESPVYVSVPHMMLHPFSFPVCVFFPVAAFVFVLFDLPIGFVSER